MAQATAFTTPVGRLVAGSLYKPNTTDAEGRPLVAKSGTSAGQPRKDYFFALAIPKGAEAQHGAFGWMATAWGAIIRAAGEAFMPHATQLPAFAWKVKDGDSAVPNKRGKRPCDQEGWPGHWVLMFSSGFAPKCFTLVGQPAGAPAGFDQVDAINLGDYVQVAGSAGGNGTQSQPGVFLNHNMVCLVGYGERIVIGPDVASAGFGGAPLPAGAMQAPPGGFKPPAVPGVPPVPGAPVVPAATVPPVPAASMPAPLPPALPSVAPSASTIPPAAVPVVPNPAFLQPPVAAAVPMPPAVPAAPVRRLTPAANGASYEQLLKAGWTDETLIANGLMVA